MHTRVVAAVLLAASAAVAQTSIIRGDSLDCFHHVFGATASIVDVDGPGFTRAWRITSQMSMNPWDMRIRCYDVQPVRANDVILATFWMRTVSSTHGYGLTTFVVEEDVGPDYFKPATLTAVAGAEWKRFQVPFVMPKDYATAPTNIPYNLSFWVTFDPQTIEIGGITVDNYGPGKTLTELGFTYEGREPDAPWRKAAAERIEKYRKSDIIVVVKDDQGRPVKGATVKVNMKRHAFGFGTAINTNELVNNARYQQELKNNFNKVVFENHLKWGPFESIATRPVLDESFNWLAANGFTEIRGHNVIWPGLDFLPNSVKTLVANRDAAGLRAAIDFRFNDVMGYTKGKVTEWDVLNEPYTNHAVQDVLGNEEMAVWFKKARAIDPDVKLYINDYSILSSGGWDLQHQNGYYDIIRFILDNGGPIDGIGMQSHFNVNVTPPARVLEILDRFAAFGKDLQVTEFDLDLPDEQIQADYTRDFLTATFSHPAIKGFVMWGFWAGAHWLPRAAMFTLDWQERQNHKVWQDLVYNQWWTNAEGVTGDDGVFRTRGFLGDYDVTVGSANPVPLKVESGKPNFVLSGKQAAGTITAVTNAAGYTAGRVAPGEIVVIWGDGIGPATLTYPVYDDGWQRFAGDIRVLFDGAPAPLIYASRGQIAAIVPYSVSGTTQIAVEYQGTVTNALEVPVAAAVPGIFTANMEGSGLVSGGALMPDNSWATLGGAVKARKGSWVALYITGEGQVAPAAADGKAPGAPYPNPVQRVEVRFGDKPSPEVWAGLVYAGVTQVNARIPEDTPSGDVPVVITVGRIATQPRLVTVPVE